MINGVLCGIIGALFIKINCKLCQLRKKYITKKWVKPIEAAIFSLISTTAFYWIPHWFAAKCVDTSKIAPVNKDLMVSYDCPKGQFNPFATLFFNSEGDALRSILSSFEGPGGINANL